MEIIALILLLFLATQITLLLFKIRSKLWSYKSYKPFWWMQQVKNKTLNSTLQNLENRCSDKVRFYNFWFQIERLKREQVPGSFAELGVYKGETACWIHAMDPERVFHLFDTFTGFTVEDLTHETKPNPDCRPYRFGDTSLEKVQTAIKGNQNLVFHVGYFPATVADLPEQRFALVHLDADLYWPTLQACQYFYPRLAPGGVLLVHDYNHHWAGVRQAVDEFTQTIPEALIAVPDRQGTVMIMRSRMIVEGT